MAGRHRHSSLWVRIWRASLGSGVLLWFVFSSASFLETLWSLLPMLEMAHIQYVCCCGRFSCDVSGVSSRFVSSFSDWRFSTQGFGLRL